jgi:hypothetical protein
MGWSASLSKEVSAMLARTMNRHSEPFAETRDDEVAIVSFAHEKSAVAQRRESFIDRSGEVN